MRTVASQVDEPDAVPIVVATMDSLEEIIESVPIVDSQRARAWLSGVPRDFRPPEPDWYYIYVTSQPTRFWNGDQLVLDAKEAAVTVFPPGIEHVARLDQPAFVFGVSPPFCHAVAPSGVTYILLVSNDDRGIDDDTAPCKTSD
jgi:hypothetical protein